MGILRKEGVEPNVEAIREAAEIVGVKFGTTKSPEKLVAKLRAYFEKRLENVEKEEWIICPVCEEITDDDDRLLRCPFCGDEGEEEESEVESVEELRSRDNEEPEPIDGADYDDSPDPVEATPVDVNSPDEEPIIEEQVEIVNKEVVKSNKLVPVKKRGSKQIIDENYDGPEIGLEPPVELDEVIDPELLSKMKVEFDKERAIIEREHVNMYSASYELGCALRAVYRGQLYKADNIKTWRSFCKQQGVSHSLAYNLIKLVSEFDRETFLSVGSSKLQLVARVESVYGLSGDDKNEILNDAKDGASVRDIKGKIDKKLEDKGEGKKKDPKGEEDGKPGKKKAEDQTITLLAKVGGKAKSYNFRDRKTHAEIEKWEKDSYVEIQISDTVVQYIVVKTDKDGVPIGITSTFRKVEKSEDKAA